MKTCMICHEDLNEVSMKKCDICVEYACLNCLAEWTANNDKCPNCRSVNKYSICNDKNITYVLHLAIPCVEKISYVKTYNNTILDRDFAFVVITHDELKQILKKYSFEARTNYFKPECQIFLKVDYNLKEWIIYINQSIKSENYYDNYHEVDEETIRIKIALNNEGNLKSNDFARYTRTLGVTCKKCRCKVYKTVKLLERNHRCKNRN